MDKFKALFGVDPDCIKETCVIMPFISREAARAFSIKSLSKGGLYSVGDNGYFTVIHTGVGPTFVGDAALYMAGTPCRDIILFGSCGAAREDGRFTIGDAGVVGRALSQDSFTSMLHKKETGASLYPEPGLSRALSSPGVAREITCLTVGSLKLEQEYLDFLKDGSIDAVDMEAAPFFAACASVKKRAASVLFATDSLKSLPYYMAMRGANRPRLNEIVRESSKLLCGLIKERLTG